MKLAGLISAAVLSFASVQIDSAAVWTIDEVRSNCIPIEESDLEVERHCTVAEFDEVISIGIHKLYYALYQDSLPESGRPGSDTHYNVLVLFTGSTDSDALGVFLVRQSLRSWSVSYDAPRILESERGPILYLPGAGIGDSRSQYSYDEYWLWKDDSWQQLDVWSWYARTHQLSDFLPPGRALDGILRSKFSLPSMRYTGKVRRSEDCHTCATGGSMTIEFEWQGLELKVKDVEYFPYAE